MNDTALPALSDGRIEEMERALFAQIAGSASVSTPSSVEVPSMNRAGRPYWLSASRLVPACVAAAAS